MIQPKIAPPKPDPTLLPNGEAEFAKPAVRIPVFHSPYSIVSESIPQMNACTAYGGEELKEFTSTYIDSDHDKYFEKSHNIKHVK
jgi:hypothetical protein